MARDAFLVVRGARGKLFKRTDHLLMAVKLINIKTKTGDSSVGVGLGLGFDALSDSMRVYRAAKFSFSLCDVHFSGQYVT